MNLYTCILTQNDCYKRKNTITPKGVMVHSTGANNPNLRRYVQPVEGDTANAPTLDILGVNKNKNDWNRSGTNACVHAFIGKLADGTVAAVQTLPWEHRGWHAGTGTSGKSANDTHISFEICEDDLIDPTYFTAVYQTAVELTAMLCAQYGIDPLAYGVVICHQEGYQQGIASNHGDVLHWFPKHGKSMDDFRLDVAAKMKNEGEFDMPIYKKFEDIPEYYKEAVKKVMDKKAMKISSGVSDDVCRVLTIMDNLGLLDQN